MSENNTKKKRLRHLFGDRYDSFEEDNSGLLEQFEERRTAPSDESEPMKPASEEPQSDTPEAVDEIDAPENEGSEETEASENVHEVEAPQTESVEVSTGVEIEKTAKEYYNEHHSQSIEDKIRDLHERALEGFDEADTDAESSADEAQEVSDESVDITTLSADEPSEEDRAAVTSGETKSYDMSQLISVLKGESTGIRPHSSDEDDEDGEDEDDAFEPAVEPTDDTNEYPHRFEYTDRLQGNNLFASFRKSAVLASFSVVLTLLTFLVCLWLELGHAAGLPFASMMSAGRFGRVYAMVSLQTLALCVLWNLDGLVRGFSKLSPRRSAPEAVAAVTTLVCVLHTVYTAAFAYESASYRTYCFVGCFALLILSVNTFVKAYTRFKAFAMVLAKKPKYAAKSMDHLAEEFTAFSKYLSEDSEVLAVTKTDSVSDFVKRTYTVPKASASAAAFTYTVLALSAVAALIGILVFQMPGYEAVSGAVSVFLFAAPIGMLVSTALPYFAASIKATALRSTILGEAACDTYDNTAVLSFDDTVAFPPKAVKVSNIKTYNDHRIDKIVVYMTRVFEKVGGPLSYVFASSLEEKASEELSVMVLETAADGMHLKVGDDDVLVGNGKYLRLFDVEAPTEASDESEMRSLTSILYLVINGTPAAKFYIRYALNRKFEPILRGMYDAGICCGVRTFDPGVDDQLIEGSLKSSNYPIHAVRKDAKEIDRVESTLSDSILSLSSAHNYLRTFLLVDRLSGLYKTNTVLAVIGSLVGLAFALFAFFSGSALSVGAMLLYQLFWLIPPVLLSLFGK